jgi:hypothetical protein
MHILSCSLCTGALANKTVGSCMQPMEDLACCCLPACDPAGCIRGDELHCCHLQRHAQGLQGRLNDVLPRYGAASTAADDSLVCTTDRLPAIFLYGKFAASTAASCFIENVLLCVSTTAVQLVLMQQHVHNVRSAACCYVLEEHNDKVTVCSGLCACTT